MGSAYSVDMSRVGGRGRRETSYATQKSMEFKPYISGMIYLIFLDDQWNWGKWNQDKGGLL